MKKIFLLAALVFLAMITMAHTRITKVPDVCTGATEQVKQPEKAIKISKLVGQWGCPVGTASYDTEENLVEAGGEKNITAIGQTIDYLIGAMDARDVVVSFEADGYVYATLQGNEVEGTYTLEGNTLIITSSGRSFPLMVEIHGKNLTLSYPFSRCPQQLKQYFRDVPTEGLSLGIRFTKVQ